MQQVDDVMRGCILKGSLVCGPLVMAGTTWIFEDAMGGAARVSLYNGAGRGFLLGSKIAIVEPFYKIAADGQVGFCICNACGVTGCSAGCSRS
jgi:hypothetical protein